MICNGQHLNITMGTDVVLRDTLIFDGETFDPALSVGITANLVSSLGKRTALEVEVADGGLIIYVPWVDGRNAGFYGLEVTGTCNSKKWATYADSLIHYTRATEMGVAEVTIESDYYDITQVVGYRYSTSPIESVTASVDDQVGTPSVEYGYDGKNLSFAFHNLKGNRGNGIASSSEVLSPDDGGTNTHTFTDDDGNEYTLHTKNGRKGTQGDSFQPIEDVSGLVLAHTTGNDNTKAMSQKGVTDELMKDRIFSLTEINIASASAVEYYIDTRGKWMYSSNTNNESHIHLSVTAGRTVKIVSEVLFNVQFIKDVNYSVADANLATESLLAWKAAGTHYIEVPAGSVYIYFRKRSGGSDVLPTYVGYVNFTKDKIAEIDNINSMVLYDSVGNHTDGAMTQKGVTDAVSKIVTLTKNDCLTLRIVAGDAQEVLGTGNRLKVIKKVPAGAEISCKCPLGNGGYIGLWATKEDAILSTVASQLEPSGNTWSKETQTLTTTQEGWFSVTMRKVYGTDPIIDEEALDYLDAMELTIKENQLLKDVVTDIDEEGTPLYIGALYQGGYSATGISQSYNYKSRVVSKDVLTIPYVGVAVECKLPIGIYLTVRTGANASDLSNHMYFFKDGDTFSVPSEHRYYRLMFFRYNDGNPENALTTSKYTLLMSEVESMIAAGEIMLTYKDKDCSDNIVNRNHFPEKLVKSFYHKGVEVTSSGNRILQLKNHLVIAHTSDTHGDAARLNNFYDFADFIEADYAAVTGDVACMDYRNNAQYLHDIDAKHSIKTLFTLGNHDVKGITSNVSSTLYSMYIDALKTRHGYTCDSTPYYYIDDAVHGVRFIAMNLYDEGGALNGAYYCSISSTQINWLISTLASTPANYGVILLYHGPESHIVNVDNKFMQSGMATSENYNTWLLYSSMTFTVPPIENIINGFIRKESGSGSYTNHNNTTVNYSYDFSELTTQIFIAHICGHEHADAIGYYKNYDGTVDGKSKQVVLNVTCTQALYASANEGLLANLTDLPRDGVGATQDAFNIYVIDKAERKIHVVRVGSSLAYEGRLRDYMTIDF